MKKDPVTVTPETSTGDAIALMRSRQVGCLPVVSDGHLVGILTDHDLIKVAAMLLEQNLKAGEQVAMGLGSRLAFSVRGAGAVAIALSFPFL